MKKICFVATIPVTLKTFLFDQTLKLQSEGWEVHWAAGPIMDKKIVPSGVTYHQLPISREPSAGAVLKTIIMFFALCKEHRFSIVQYSTPIAALCCSIASFFAKVPNRIYAQWGIRYVAFGGLRRWILKVLEKTSCYFSTVIQPDSFGNLEFSIKEGLYSSLKGQVIGNGSACGVDFERFDFGKKSFYRTEIRSKYDIPESAYVFGFVGSIRTDKGINELVSAFEQLSTSVDFAQLWLFLIGDLNFEYDLQPRTLESLKANPWVVKTGAVNEVERYLSAIDCLVFPSYREGFGMVVIEAAAMGVPSIVTNIPGPSEAVENGNSGSIVELYDVRGLSDAMYLYASNPEETKAQGINARRLVENKYERASLMNAYLKNKSEMFLLSKTKESSS